MSLLLFLWQTSGPILLIALATGLVSGGCSAGLIALISYAIAQESAGAVVAVAFVGLGAIALLLAMVSRVLLVRFSQAAVFELQLQLCRQILAAELKSLETLGLPSLLVILTDDIQAIAAAASILPVLMINIAGTVGCMVYVAWLSWQVLALVLLITLVASLSCRWFLGAGRRGLAAAREQQDRLFQHFRSLIEGIKELKLHYLGRQDFFELDLQPTARQVKQYNQQGLSLFAILDSWGKFIYFFAVGLVLFALPNWVGISPNTRVAYVLTFTYLLGPMENLVNKLPLLGQASVALDKLAALGLTINQPVAALAPPPVQPWQRLELKGVTHTYRGDGTEFTLGPVNLTVQPGELIFIIGGNGSGKSTLAKVITGLYRPQSGAIWLDQQPIDEANQEWYRQHFSAVFADFYLFERLLGFSDDQDDCLWHGCADRKAEDYLQKLQLSHKVHLEHGRFSTVDLSQGQRKRLTLLSAYMENRPIYLFDEWAADQDPAFKHIFYTQLLPDLKAQGKTVFVISHDDHYFHMGDRILKLDYGQVEFDQSPSSAKLGYMQSDGVVE
ncbi:cyclic peptide export ABC transporter [Nodosilinea sp. LEGE 07088]|uniref:cyclic peptide export ABC transporter n=1 Tax=Nodosilinea sp. LEGE 07088 TaxID=2777968 RepID=UPI00187FB0A1|nr:cyclic peptide export ABC transporter [Nodosilinea sp. LEGE 07088]MBE9138958.1 cyclic peptide export ABC transporter [Nodosilinea sp. LEGE 07088]